MEQEKKEGETNVCLSDDVDVVDMTNSDSSSAWILTEFTHAHTHEHTALRCARRSQERERGGAEGGLPSGIQSDVKSPASSSSSSSSPPTSWWTKPPPSRPRPPSSSPPLERGDLNDRKHASRFTVTRDLPQKRAAAAADRHIGRLIGGKKVLLGKDIDMPRLPNVLCVIIV